MATVIVSDRRPEVRTKEVARFDNVPDIWTGKEIVQRFGIADHLHVVRETRFAGRSVVQQGRS